MLTEYLKSSDRNAVPDRLALAQLACALCIVAALWPLLGAVAAGSAALAGGISALSSWYAGRKIVNCRARTAEQFVRNLYVAQGLKLLLAAALFCIVFAAVEVNFPVFVATYAITIAVFGFALAARLAKEPPLARKQAPAPAQGEGS